MKKMLVALALCGVVAGAVAFPALAQGDAQAIARIPVRFIVGDKVLPAGTYLIGPRGSDWTVLLVESVDHKWAASLPVTQGGPATSIAPKVQVNFKNYFGEYFLTQVAFPARNTRNADVTKEDAERILAKLNLSPGERVDIVK